MPANIETTWMPVALSRHLGRKPMKLKLAGVPVVLWRGEGGVAGFIDRCPHRNYPLSEGRVENGRLVCPYHGWAFTRQGQCADVPGCSGDLSRLGAETIGVHEGQGVVWACLKPQTDGAAGLLPMPEGPDYDHFWWAMKPETARVFDALDNVLDPFHTNFIHNGYIRVRHRRQRVEQTLHVFEDGFEAVYDQDTDYGWMSRVLEGPRSSSRGRYFPPVAFQGIWESRGALNLCVTIWFVPMDEHTIRPFARFSTPRAKGPAWLKEALIRLFLFRVIEQDADALGQLHDNIVTFGGPRFKAGPADRLGDKLMRLYNGQKLAPETLGPFEIYL
ncbi:MAG: Rieske 2Fe-2S domain-containing protein [Asticcacaulis sp.]